MTFLAYFALGTAIVLVLFVLSGPNKKEHRDYVIMTFVLFFNTIASTLLALDKLGVL